VLYVVSCFRLFRFEFLLYYYTITHWTLTLKTFEALSTQVMNICTKFHWNPSIKWRDILSQVLASGQRTDGQPEKAMFSAYYGGGIHKQSYVQHTDACLLYSVSQKSRALKLLRYFHLWWTCVTENYLGYCPNIFLPLGQFWSIFLNICINCITFTSKTSHFNNSIKFITKFVIFR